MITCPYCGTMYDSFESKCARCGGVLPSPEIEKVPARRPTNGDILDERTKKALRIFLAVSLLAGATCAGVVLLATFSTWQSVSRTSAQYLATQELTIQATSESIPIEIVLASRQRCEEILEPSELKSARWSGEEMCIRFLVRNTWKDRLLMLPLPSSGTHGDFYNSPCVYGGGPYGGDYVEVGETDEYVCFEDESVVLETFCLRARPYFEPELEKTICTTVADGQ